MLNTIGLEVEKDYDEVVGMTLQNPRLLSFTAPYGV